MVKEAELIKGFQQVSYVELQETLNTAFADTGEKLSFLAYKLQVESTTTAQNALNKENQVVSDQILTKALNILQINGLVVWMNGERKYYIKN